MSLKAQQRYINKHREKVREWSRKSNKKNSWKYREGKNERRKELRIIAIELGRCSACFKEKDNPKRKICRKCRETNINWYYKKRLKNK